MSMAKRANYILILVAAVWGASYPIARMAVRDIAPSAFVFGRFLLAALVLLPMAAPHLRNLRAARIGLVLGLIEGAVCAILALNISSMPASRCAFIMGSSVVMVPIWATLFRLQHLTVFNVARTFLSLVGLYFLTGARLNRMTLPDLWILGAAALWALDIVLLKKQTQHESPRVEAVAFYQSATTCIVPAVLLLRSWPSTLGTLTWSSGFGLLYCALFATVMNLLLQIRYQRHTSAAHAALRLSMEPLFATVVAVIFFQDVITSSMLVGGGLMVMATVLPELYELVTQRLAARKLPPKVASRQPSHAAVALTAHSKRPLFVRVPGADAPLARSMSMGLQHELLNPHLLGVRSGR